jgi:hypothetical protein
VTSCAFADSVRNAFYAQGQPQVLDAYSPVTGKWYTMTGLPEVAHFTNGMTVPVMHFYGGIDAEVVVW